MSISAEYITHMGDDMMVVNSARVSFDKESEFITEWVDENGRTHIDPKGVMGPHDKRLIIYLAKHNHWTPFSHPQITLRETVPIFVARQRFKHMVGFTYNEVSRRYVDDDPEFYIPDKWRSRPDGSVKQGSGGVLENSHTLKLYARQQAHECKRLYQSFIDQGVAPEQARMILPQSMLTSYYVTGSLSAFARAYKQRIDSHSQKEIQILASKWGEIISQLYPVSWGALTK